MPFSEEKEYTVDDSPVTAAELIQMAEAFNDNYAEQCIKSTSEAVGILRAEGFIVDINTDV